MVAFDSNQSARMQQASSQNECRYCAEELRPKAKYCANCERFQTFGGRLAGDINVTSLIALVPIVTLAVAFLNKTIVFPYSKVRATVLRCTSEEVVAALSNTGTRDGIVEGGSAVFAPTNRDYDRSLSPTGERYEPIVVKAGQALVSRLSFTEVGGPEPVPAPQVQAPKTCVYDIAVSVLEFGGRRESVPAGRCRC